MITHLRVGTFRGCDKVRDIDEDARYEDVDVVDTVESTTCPTCTLLYAKHKKPTEDPPDTH